MRNENADNERKNITAEEGGRKREYNRQCDSCDRTDRILRVGLSTV